MESLIDQPEKKERTPPAQDRVTLTKAESEKLDKWINQIKDTSKGFLTLSKSDIVNFLIAEHKEELSTKEFYQLRLRNYDPIRHMNWIMQELKSALARNDMSAVADLQAEIKGIELAGISKASSTRTPPRSPNLKDKKPRLRKSKEISIPNPASEDIETTKSEL